MRVAANNVIVRFILPAGSILVLAILLSTGLLNVPQHYLLAGAGLVAIFIITFASPEAGLYILIFSMLLSPEIIVGKVATAGFLKRGVTLRLDDFLLVIIGVSWFARTALEKDKGILRETPLNKPIFWFTVAMVVSTAWGFINGLVRPVAGFFYTLKLFEYFLVYFMTVNILRNKDQVRKLVIALLVVCVLVSLYGVYQIPLGHRVTTPFEGEIPEPNTFGGYIILILSLVLGIAMAHNSSRVRWAMVPLFFIAIPLLFSFSRSSMVGLIGMYLALLAFSPRRGIVILGFIFMVLAGPVLIPQKVVDRVTHTWEQPKRPSLRHPLQVKVFGIWLDTSTSARIISYRQLSKDWLNHPVLGHGITGYQFMDAQFPRIVAEMGLVGLIIFLWLLISIFRVSYRTFKEAKTPLFRSLGLGLTVAICALAVHGLGTNTFFIVRIMEPFWLTVGIVVRLLQIEAEEELTGPSLPSSALSPALQR
jgi:hypothetical protein